MGKEFIQLTGNDDNAFEFNKRGGVGAISVTANIAPKLCSDFQKLSVSNNSNDINEADKLDKILQPVHSAMFIESNPSPVKYAAKLMNLCVPGAGPGCAVPCRAARNASLSLALFAPGWSLEAGPGRGAQSPAAAAAADRSFWDGLRLQQ